MKNERGPGTAEPVPEGEIESLSFEPYGTTIAPRKGTFWRHARSGDVYEVLMVVTREEDMIPAVIYARRDRHETGDWRVWDRKVSVFCDGRYRRVG